jgi:hypothetical protein
MAQGGDPGRGAGAAISPIARRWCVPLDTLARRPPAGRIGFRPAARRRMAPQENQRPAWLNWAFLVIFLWSSWQLAGFWFERLR